MQNQNPLFPVFLRTDRLTILIVGGGNVAEEKLHFLLKSSPDSRIILVSPDISEKIISYSDTYDITLVNRKYIKEDLKGIDLVVAATNNKEINSYIWTNSKLEGVLINVADTPDLCDFYLGSIVTKGDFKIAISTNGQSPTLAKRLRQLLEKSLPDEINQLAEHLNKVRNLFGDSFETKVKELNRITKNLINN